MLLPPGAVLESLNLGTWFEGGEAEEEEDEQEGEQQHQQEQQQQQQAAAQHLAEELAALASVPQLSNLRSLRLDDHNSHDTAVWRRSLPALLDRTPQLTDLVLAEWAPRRLPECIRLRSGLRSLGLEGQRMAELPEGPYLQGLEALQLVLQAFSQVPPALTAATALTRLDLSHNGGMQLSAAVLDALPCLRALTLAGTGSLPEGRYLAGLQELSLVNHSFTRLPPALAAATALTCLDLRRHAAAPKGASEGQQAALDEEKEDLELPVEDARAILAPLPLRQLCLSPALAGSPGVETLRSACPQLEISFLRPHEWWSE
ncbi:hypothetical protein ABPG75_005528 [Micractinium tetrahymenae]